MKSYTDLEQSKKLAEFLPIAKSIEEAKKKYPPGKYTGELIFY